METQTLRKAGLTEGEARTYLALLKIGSSSTGPIIDETKISRSIIYQILDNLIDKGLVSYITKEKTKYFQASEPSRLKDFLDEKEREFNKNRDEVENLIPKLLSLTKKTKENEVRVFAGFKGMITVHEHTYEKLEKGEEYYYFGIPPEQPEHFHAYWNKDHKRRVKAKIKCRLLFHPSTAKKLLINRNSYKDCDARYMDIDVKTPSWFMGYKNVAVIGFPSTEPITIEIIKKEIADSFKAYFEEFWRKSRKSL